MKKIILAGAAVVAMTMGSSVWAATGTCTSTTGVVSTMGACTTDVKITVNPKIIVKNVGDIQITAWDGATTGTTTGTDDLCVGTNSFVGAEMYATGITDFEMLNGGTSTDTLAYVLDIDGSTVAIGSTNGVSVANVSNLGCASDASTLTATVQNSAALLVDEGDYSQTVTLVVAPE